MANPVFCKAECVLIGGARSARATAAVEVGKHHKLTWWSVILYFCIVPHSVKHGRALIGRKQAQTCKAVNAGIFGVRHLMPLTLQIKMLHSDSALAGGTQRNVSNALTQRSI